jgi:hypothetical protein
MKANPKSIKYWLIEFLAGNDVIVLNAHISAQYVETKENKILIENVNGALISHNIFPAVDNIKLRISQIVK